MWGIQASPSQFILGLTPVGGFFFFSSLVLWLGPERELGTSLVNVIPVLQYLKG